MRLAQVAAAIGAPMVLLGGLLGAAPARPPLTYSLAPVLVNGVLDHLAVQVSFRGDPDGVTEVRLPDDWAGYARLHEALSGFSASTGRMSRPSAALLRLSHKPSEPVTLSYQVRGRSAEAGADYRPDLDERGFLMLGETAFAWPIGRLANPAKAQIDKIPPGWVMASTLESARTVNEMRESVTVAGDDVQLLKREVGGAPVRLAIRGPLTFTDPQLVRTGRLGAALSDTLARILEAQRELSGEAARPFVAVVQSVPTTPGRYSRDGIGRSDGAVFFFSADNNMLWLSLRVLAHEPVHAWLPGRVGGLPAGAAEPSGYWFSEGFADFVAFRSLVRAGEWRPDDYAAALNLRLDPASLLKEPVVSNAEIVSSYGRRPELGQAPYRRGHVLALIWDSRLRTASNGRLGIDDVLRAMRARAAGGRTSDVLFPIVYRELGGPDPTGDIEAHVIRGLPVAVPASLYGGCLRVRPRQGPGASGWSVDHLISKAERDRCAPLLFGPGARVIWSSQERRD